MNIEELYKAHYRKVFGSAYDVLKIVALSHDVAHDVAQDVFTRLAARESLDDIRDIEGFLFVMARNAAMNYRRKVSREASFDEAYSKAAPCIIEKIEGMVDLEKAIKRLPKKQRAVFQQVKEHRALKSCIVERGTLIPSI